VDGEMMVTFGVDTHTDVHVAAVLDPAGRLLATWAESFGPVNKVGMEGIGSFGAGLLRFLADYGLAVIEVDRPTGQGGAATASPIPLMLSRPHGLFSPAGPPGRLSPAMPRWR
jgi:hypothetical protein